MQLGIQGRHFTRDGMPVVYAGLSEFSLFNRYLRGENPDPIFADRLDVLAEVKGQAARTGDGAWLLPVLRVFAMANSFMQLNPLGADHRYYDGVSVFTDIARSYGFVVDWECLADCQVLMPNLADQQAHWTKMTAALVGRPNALLSLGNEAPKNGFQSEPFTRVALLCSRGSNLGGAYPPPNEWDYSDYHTRRDGIKGLAACGRYLCFVVGGDPDASPPWPGLAHPAVVKEWLGAADQDEPGRRTSHPADHYRAAIDMAAWGAGGCFHSDCGIRSVPFTPIQRACGLAFFMGLSKCDPVQTYDGRIP